MLYLYVSCFNMKKKWNKSKQTREIKKFTLDGTIFINEELLLGALLETGNINSSYLLYLKPFTCTILFNSQNNLMKHY